MKLLWHRRGNIETRLRDETQKEPPNHDLIFELEAAIDLINDYFSTVRSRLAALDEGTITFDLLWTCFPPLSLVTGSDLDKLGQQRLSRVRETKYQEAWGGGHVFCLDTDYISSDGKDTGFVGDMTLDIDAFRSAKPILDLPLHPFHLRPSHERERDALIERGDKWLRLRGRHVQEYRGHAISGEGRYSSAKFNVGVVF